MCSKRKLLSLGPAAFALALLASNPPFRAAAQQPGPAFRTESPRPLSRFQPKQIRLLEKLNRADRWNLPRLRQIVVPDRWDLPESAYSPLPAYLPWAVPHEKAMLVDLRRQAFAAYRRGDLVRWGPISSGRREQPTPAGVYRLNWRAKSRRSSIDQSWLMEWYFNFHATRGIAFHKYAMPGRPASHACIRMLERDARWLYNWGRGWTEAGSAGLIHPGTPVLIVGQYDFDAPRPWLNPGWMWEQRAGQAQAPPAESQARNRD